MAAFTRRPPLTILSLLRVIIFSEGRSRVVRNAFRGSVSVGICLLRRKGRRPSPVLAEQELRRRAREGRLPHAVPRPVPVPARALPGDRRRAEGGGAPPAGSEPKILVRSPR